MGKQFYKLVKLRLIKRILYNMQNSKHILFENISLTKLLMRKLTNVKMIDKN